MDTTVRIVMKETGTPSRSKGRGWARVEGVEGSFATRTGRAVNVVGVGFTVIVGVELRRASGKFDKLRGAVNLVATGEPTDTVTVSVGSPQSYDVVVLGARRAV